jgi:hypothetical protein
LKNGPGFDASLAPWALRGTARSKEIVDAFRDDRKRGHAFPVEDPDEAAARIEERVRKDIAPRLGAGCW